MGKNRARNKARREAQAIEARRTVLPAELRRTLGIGECQMANAGFFGRRTAAKETVSLNREYRGIGVKHNYQEIDPAYGWVANRDPSIKGYTVPTLVPKQRRNPETKKIETVIDSESGKPLMVSTLDGRHLSPEERKAKAKSRREAQAAALSLLQRTCKQLNVKADDEGMRSAANHLVKEAHARRQSFLRCVESINAVTFNRNVLGEIPQYGNDHHNACSTVRHASRPEHRLPVTRTTAGPLSDYRIEASSRVQRFNTQGVSRDDQGLPKIVRLTPAFNRAAVTEHGIEIDPVQHLPDQIVFEENRAQFRPVRAPNPWRSEDGSAKRLFFRKEEE